jgi:hyperosmotically inducible periplasmic protein
MNHPIKMSLVVLGLALGCSLTACAPTRTRESTGAYVDDASITTKVKAAILADAGLKVFEIHVVTDKDVVQLSGFVDSPSMIGRASDVAGRVAGVRGVRNDLVVR